MPSVNVTVAGSDSDRVSFSRMVFTACGSQQGWSMWRRRRR